MRWTLTGGSEFTVFQIDKGLQVKYSQFSCCIRMMDEIYFLFEKIPISHNFVDAHQLPNKYPIQLIMRFTYHAFTEIETHFHSDAFAGDSSPLTDRTISVSNNNNGPFGSVCKSRINEFKMTVETCRLCFEKKRRPISIFTGKGIKLNIAETIRLHFRDEVNNWFHVHIRMTMALSLGDIFLLEIFPFRSTKITIFCRNSFAYIVGRN